MRRRNRAVRAASAAAGRARRQGDQRQRERRAAQEHAPAQRVEGRRPRPGRAARRRRPARSKRRRRQDQRPPSTWPRKSRISHGISPSARCVFTPRASTNQRHGSTTSAASRTVVTRRARCPRTSPPGTTTRASGPDQAAGQDLGGEQGEEFREVRHPTRVAANGPAATRSARPRARHRSNGPSARRPARRSSAVRRRCPAARARSARAWRTTWESPGRRSPRGLRPRRTSVASKTSSTPSAASWKPRVTWSWICCSIPRGPDAPAAVSVTSRPTVARKSSTSAQAKPSWRRRAAMTWA